MEVGADTNKEIAGVVPTYIIELVEDHPEVGKTGAWLAGKREFIEYLKSDVIPKHEGRIASGEMQAGEAAALELAVIVGEVVDAASRGRSR
ncbi:MAG: hypothetical protein AAB909_04360 [Patescibacteria group bacterium]